MPIHAEGRVELQTFDEGKDPGTSQASATHSHEIDVSSSSQTAASAPTAIVGLGVAPPRKDLCQCMFGKVWEFWERVESCVRRFEKRSIYIQMFTAVPRAFTNVFFIDNFFIGLLWCIVFTVAEPKLGGWAMFGAFVGNLYVWRIFGTEPLMRAIPPAHLPAYSLNCVATAMGIAFFTPYDDTDSLSNFLIAGGVCVMSIWVITLKLMWESSYVMPLLAFAFNIAIMFWLGYLYAVQWSDLDYVTNDTREQYDWNPLTPTPLHESFVGYDEYIEDFDLGEFHKGVFNGYALLYFQSDYRMGVIVFLSVFAVDPELGLLTYAGAWLAQGVGLASAEPIVSLNLGLVSFNAVLVAGMIGKIMSRGTTWMQRWWSAFCWTLMCYPCQAVISHFMLTFHLPALSLPFSIIVSAYLLVQRWHDLRKYYNGLALKAIAAYNTKLAYAVHP